MFIEVVGKVEHNCQLAVERLVNFGNDFGKSLSSYTYHTQYTHAYIHLNLYTATECIAIFFYRS